MKKESLIEMDAKTGKLAEDSFEEAYSLKNLKNCSLLHLQD